MPARFGRSDSINCSTEGLHLLVDSTGIKFIGEGKGECKCKKHGDERRSQRPKWNIGIDVKTLQIKAICVNSEHVSDALVVPDFLQKLPQDEVLHSLTGVGAYDTHLVYEAVLKRAAAISMISITQEYSNTQFEYWNVVLAAC